MDVEANVKTLCAGLIEEHPWGSNHQNTKNFPD